MFVVRAKHKGNTVSKRNIILIRELDRSSCLLFPLVVSRIVLSYFLQESSRVAFRQGKKKRKRVILIILNFHSVDLILQVNYHRFFFFFITETSLIAKQMNF